MGDNLSFKYIDLLKIVMLFSQAGVECSGIASRYFFANGDTPDKNSELSHRIPDPFLNFADAVQLAKDLKSGEVTLKDGVFYKLMEYHPEEEGL